MSNTVDNATSSESEYDSDYSSDEDVTVIGTTTAPTVEPIFETTVVVPNGNADSTAEPAHHFNKIILKTFICNSTS